MWWRRWLSQGCVGTLWAVHGWKIKPVGVCTPLKCLRRPKNPKDWNLVIQSKALCFEQSSPCWGWEELFGKEHFWFSKSSPACPAAFCQFFRSSWCSSLLCIRSFQLVSGGGSYEPLCYVTVCICRIWDSKSSHPTFLLHPLCLISGVRCNWNNVCEYLELLRGGWEWWGAPSRSTQRHGTEPLTMESLGAVLSFALRLSFPVNERMREGAWT